MSEHAETEGKELHPMENELELNSQLKNLWMNDDEMPKGRNLKDSIWPYRINLIV